MATTTTTTDLGVLASKIKTELGQLGSAIRASLNHACNAGRCLIQAKEQVGHGNFGKWVKENCQITHGTANVYMKVAREWDNYDAADLEQYTLREFLEACKVAPLKRKKGKTKTEATQDTANQPASTTTNEAAVETPVAQPASKPATKTAVSLFDPPAARERDRVMDMANELGVDPVSLKTALIKHGFLSESLAA